MQSTKFIGKFNLVGTVVNIVVVIIFVVRKSKGFGLPSVQDIC